MRFLMLLLLFLIGCSQHPAEDDWYENIKTGKRVKIAKAQNGVEMLKTLEGLKQKASEIPMVIIIHGDSSEVINGKCVYTITVINDYGTNVFLEEIYGVNDFEKDFMLIKK